MRTTFPASGIHAQDHLLLHTRYNAVAYVTDYASPQAALDAVPDGGGVVIFPAGIYLLAASLIVRKPNTRLLSFGATLTANHINAEILIDASGIDDAFIDGFSMDGANLSKYAVRIANSTNSTVSNCMIKNITSVGILVGNDTEGCKIMGNKITLPVDDPFGTVINATGVQLSSSCVDQYGGGQSDTLTFTAPVSLSKNHVVEGNEVINGTHGISLYGARACRVRSNYVNGQTHRGIILSPVASYNLVGGNICEGFGSTGIHLAEGSSYNQIIGNEAFTLVSNYQGNCFKAYYGCNHNVFSGNFARGSKFAAYRISMGSQYNQLSNNRAVDCETGIEIESYINANSDHYVQGVTYQPATPPACVGNIVDANKLADCRTGVRLAQRGTVELNKRGIGANIFMVCQSDLAEIEETAGKITQ